MGEEDAFLRGIRAHPGDDALRLVYADWLEERGDLRGNFLRLQLGLTSLAPDHLHRVGGEHELSLLRKACDPEWLAVVEPGLGPGEDPNFRSCGCFAPWNSSA
jgi:uncharacterized protein (TIGR02996 family)